MLSKKENTNEIVTNLQKYWNYRAKSYSESNIEELNNFKGEAWLKILLKNAPNKKKLKVLDVGAGPGLFSILMALAGHEVTAVDISSEMIKSARENAKSFNVNVNFVQVDGIELPFEDKSFDFIISRNVLWNLEYPKEALKEWKRLLDEDGHLLYFDANQYLHLFKEENSKRYDEDMKNMEKIFGSKEVKTKEVENLEKIAKKLVLSKEERPSWDIKALKECGYNLIKVEEDMGKYVWDERQKVEQKSRPLFMVLAK